MDNFKMEEHHFDELLDVDQLDSTLTENQLVDSKNELQSKLLDSLNWNKVEEESHWYNNKTIWFVGALTVIVIGGVVYYFYFYQPSNGPSSAPSTFSRENFNHITTELPENSNEIQVSDERTSSSPTQNMSDIERQRFESYPYDTAQNAWNEHSHYFRIIFSPRLKKPLIRNQGGGFCLLLFLTLAKVNLSVRFWSLASLIQIYNNLFNIVFHIFISTNCQWS